MAYLGNPIKIQAILNAVGNADTLIDIGCNYGFMAKAFLDNRLVKKCFGIDKTIKVVDPRLLKNPAFTFYEGDLVDFVFPQTYEVIIYTATHHRVLETYGKDVAMNVWRKIVNACEKTIVFETGMLAESGVDFTAELAKYYSNDKEHWDEIISVVGDRLLGVEELIKIPVRGETRIVYKIMLSEPDRC